MKSISKFLYVIIILLGSSCAERQPIKESENLIFVDLEKENSVSMYDLFSKVELIPLENTNEAVVGEPIREMRVDNGHFYLLTGKQEVIWHFDEKGHFVDKINHYGSGPNEYSTLSDFRFNRFNGDLEILCCWGYINVYDHSGKTFKKRISFDWNKTSVVHNFIELSPNKYLFFSKSRKGNKMMWYDVEKNDIIAECYNLPKFLFFNTPFHHTFTPFYSYNDRVHFVQAYNGTVFTADSEGYFKSEYNFDFGEYNFDISGLEDKDMRYYITYTATVGAKYANRFIAYGENSKYYISRFNFRKKLSHLVMDKKTGKTYYFTKLKENCLCFPLCMDEKALYFISYPEELNVAVNPNILSKEDRDEINKVSPADNPIIIKYTFK
ncbi:6-bladed beta-propeller [Bacteroides graminisolvens]|uniref:6-bladed beta-propeller n=1 Tax=Bacteroides graminisolvens DSM 19988 = JCM 15093 TaxID=1121097 RepID=A0A069D2Y8_9BACE|nr:6-bladed beta-propeller [Bacteroides graminisolvens]GAK36685.1 hypothetical protein JCM15093_1869 [Bacteroides graminisolvens DSM 19988 = JCM 15093]